MLLPGRGRISQACCPQTYGAYAETLDLVNVVVELFQRL